MFVCANILLLVCATLIEVVCTHLRTFCSSKTKTARYPLAAIWVNVDVTRRCNIIVLYLHASVDE